MLLFCLIIILNIYIVQCDQRDPDGCYIRMDVGFLKCVTGPSSGDKPEFFNK